MDYPGNLYVVAAPSGTGKSSLVNALLELDSHLVVTVSHTTRAPRGQEQDGREYHFVGEPAFRAMVARGEFVEWAEVHGNLYGTSRAEIESRIASGQDVVLEIDWQGALQIKQLFPHAVLIFILPPSCRHAWPRPGAPSCSRSPIRPTRGCASSAGTDPTPWRRCTPPSSTGGPIPG